MKMARNGHEVRFQLDSGASICVHLPRGNLQGGLWRGQRSHTGQRGRNLVMNSKMEETPLGKTKVQVISPKNGGRYSVKFMVMKSYCKPLLGLRPSQQMHLISVLEENI